MTTRFTNENSDQLSCVAEELALRLLLSQTTVTLELFGLLDDGVSNALVRAVVRTHIVES